MNGAEQNHSCRFHLAMGICCLTILTVSLTGCWLTSLDLQHIGSKVFGVTMLSAMFAPVPAYWHQRKRALFRDVSLTIPWCMLLAILTPLPFLLGSHLHFPLRDSLFARIDAAIGVNSPAIVDWAGGRRLGSLINHTYGLLMWYLLAAIFVPALTGKKEAKLFLAANMIAIIVAIPCLTLCPAIGPWCAEHLAPFDGQLHVQTQIMQLRTPGSVSFSLLDGAGIVSFPSFHVIWAIFCTAAFWGYRYLRIPLCVLSALIIASTLTTGWHYGVDVIAGMIVAVFSLAMGKCFLSWSLRGEVNTSSFM